MESLVRNQDVLYQAYGSHKLVASRHKRYKSDSSERPAKIISSAEKSFHQSKQGMNKDKVRTDGGERVFSDTESVCSLNQEILQLERQLKVQTRERNALEKALGLGCQASFLDSSNDTSMTKSTKQLIKEIAVLELEVMHLERYLLSLYRIAFDEQVSTLSSSKDDVDGLKQSLCSQPSIAGEITRPKKLSKKADAEPSTNRTSLSQLSHSRDVHRCHSSLSYRSTCSARMSPSSETLTRAVQSCHSQPLSFVDDEHNAASGVISLAEYLGTNIADHVLETPNKISEEMVRCMGSIYCKLSEPPLVHHGPPSPTSSFSWSSAPSPQYMGDIWSPHCRKESSLDTRLINPFRVEGLKEFSGPYNSMVEIRSICRESQRLQDIEHLLQTYKLLLNRLETLDLKEMKNEERIAFWLNVHNALMMHAYLTYGIPQRSLRKARLLYKAKCVISGHLINAETIQGSILKCGTNSFGQRIRTFLSPRTKFKSGHDCHSYSIEHPEPILHFAVCSGSYSDPAVRIYTPKKLFEQLETAKGEYIRATVGIWKEQKILLPKLIDSYSKDKNLNTQNVFDMIQCYLPETLRMAMQRSQQNKPSKMIEWVPHNFGFRYLLCRELAGPHTS